MIIDIIANGDVTKYEFIKDMKTYEVQIKLLINEIKKFLNVVFGKTISIIGFDLRSISEPQINYSLWYDSLIIGRLTYSPISLKKSLNFFCSYSILPRLYFLNLSFIRSLITSTRQIISIHIGKKPKIIDEIDSI